MANDSPWALPGATPAASSAPQQSVAASPWALPDANAQTAATLRSNLQASTGTSPEAEAKVNHLARFVGVPADTVRSQPDAIKATASQQLFDASKLAENSPETANLLSQQQNMNVLREDIPNVAATEAAVKGLAEVSQRGYFADIGSAALSTADKIHLAGIRAQLALQPYLPGFLKSNPAELSEAMSSGGDAFKAAQAEAPTTIPGEITSGGLYALAGPAAPALVAGAEGVYAEQDLLGQGADPDAARLSAAVQGGLNGLLQYVPMGKVLLGQGVKKGLTSTAAAATKALLVGAGQSGISDEATSKILDDVGQPELGAQYAPSLAKMAQGGAFMAGIHIASSAIHAGMDREGNPTPEAEDAKAKDANAAQTILQKLGELATTGKFRELDPEGFHQFVSDVSEGSGAPDLYVDARTLSEALDKAGVTGDALAAKLPDVAGQMREALQTEGMVRMSAADYATHIAGGPVDELLQPHLRIDPAGMTFAEAKTHAEGQAVEATAENAQPVEADPFADSAKQTEESIRAQLDGANRFPADVNESYAKLAADYYSTTAQREGVLPHELFAKHPLNIAAEDVAGEHLDQRASRADLRALHEGIPLKDATLDRDGAHTPSGPEDGAPAFDVTRNGVYPEDFYGPSGLRYYGTGAYAQDAEMMAHLRRLEARPNHSITVYRAVGRDGVNKIQPGDWVTPSRQYAKDHGEGALNGDYKIIKADVKARDIFTSGDSLLEWGYHPQDFLPERLPKPESDPLAQGARGTYSPESNTISLLKDADLSTFLHELGHHFLETHASIASQEGASEGIKSDVQALMAQSGYAGSIAEWLAQPIDARRDAHENFARSFEAYLMEGKSPSTELQPLFSRFRSWLVQVYKSLTALHVNLTDDVRQIMDRMIASDETIRQAEAVRGMAPMFDLKPEGMSDEQFRAYRDVAEQATTEAVDSLQGKSLKDMQWLSNAKSKALKAIQARANGARSAIREEVTQEVDALPAFQAKDYLDTESDPNREHKQAMTDWRSQRDAVPKDQRAQWVDEHPAPERPRSTLDDWKDAQAAEDKSVRDSAGQKAMEGKTGLERGQALQKAKRAIANEVEAHMIEWEKSHPKPKTDRIVPDLEISADKFGFNSADEMLQAIRDAGNRSDVIDAATDQRMLQRHGELVDPVSIDRAADAAIHNDVRARVIATELRALAKAVGGSPGLLAKAAKEAAEASVAAKNVGDLRVAQYAIAEGKAARAAAKAFKAGDLKEAAIQKRAQLLNNALERAAREARDDIAAGLKYQAKFDRATTRARLDGQFLTRIDEIRGLVDFRKNPSTFNRGKANLQTWADGLRDAGEEPQISEWLGQLETPQGYKDMTIEQFRGTVAALKSLEFIARARREVTVEGKRIALRYLIDNQLIPRMDERGERFTKQDLVEPPKAEIDGYWKALTHWLAVHMRLVDGDLKPQEFKFNRYDMHELDGPFRKALLDPFLDANYLKVDLAREVSNLAGKVGDELGRDWQKALYDIVPNAILPDPDLSSFNRPVPMKITRGRMLGIARHVGNESNFDKLTKGYGWAPADVWKFLRQNMTAKDWQATQAHWDSFEPLWKRTVEMVRRIGGVPPPKIEAREFQITTPAGEAISMRGGYSPIDYDPLRSRLSVQKGEFSLDPGDKVSEMPVYRATTTSNGSLTNRAQGYTDRVSLDFHSSDARIRDTIHDLAYREALLDATKVVNDDAFRDKFQKVYGREEFQALTTWLKNVRDTNVEDPRSRNFDKAMMYFRQGIVLTGIGYRVSTVLKHGGAAAFKSLGYLGNGAGAGYFAARIARMGTGHASEDIAAAKEKFAEIRTRSLQMDRDYKVGSRSMYEAEDWRAKNDRFGHYMVATSDLLSAVPTAWAAYDLATTRGIPESMGGDGKPMSEAEAVRYANSIVRQAHGSALEVTRSNFMQARGAKGFFGALYGFMNNTYGQMGDLLDKSVSGGHFKNNPAVAARLMATLIIPAVWTALLKNGGPDDREHESYAGWASKAIGGEVAATVPLVRDAWNLLEGMMDGKHHESVVAPIQAITDVLKSGKDVWDEAHGKTSRILQDIGNAIGEWGHIAGLGELGHILQHMRDVSDGKKPADPNPAKELKDTVM